MLAERKGSLLRSSPRLHHGLPELKHASMEDEDPFDAKTWGSVPRVLVVDDDPHVRAALKRVLTHPLNRGRIEVDAVGGADEAFERLEGERYSLILSDFRMPGRDGVDLLRAARASHPATLGVIVTAFPQDEKVIRARAEGQVAMIIAKPWRMLDVIDTVNYLTWHARSLD